jgi:hypothetical protein
MTIMLVNPPKRGGRKMAGKKRKKLTGAAKRAFLRRMAAGRRKAAGGGKRKSSRKSGGAARKRTQRTSPSTRRVHIQGAPMAAKKRKATSGTRRKSSGGKRRRRSSGKSITLRRVTGRVYRTNGLGNIGGGIVRKMTSAAKKGAVVTGGRAAVNIVSRMLPLGQTVPMRAVSQVVATGLIGFFGEKFLGREMGELAMIGGFDALYTSLVRNFNVPVIGAALGDDVIQGYYSGGDIGAYYDTGRSTLPAGAPVGAGIGDAQDMGDEAFMQY